MEITIKSDGRMVSVEVTAEVGEFWEQSRRESRNLQQEQQRHWDGRGYDEYITATESRLPYCETPEQYVCRMETRAEILSVLALCTDTQRERFLLHALYDLSYGEVAELFGCSKSAVEKSITAVKKIFQKFWKGGIR